MLNNTVNSALQIIRTVFLNSDSVELTVVDFIPTENVLPACKATTVNTTACKCTIPKLIFALLSLLILILWQQI